MVVLYVSKQIVELHGGSIGVEFPPDGGTRLLVQLPLGGAALSGGANDLPDARRRWVLVVEDDPTIREVLVGALEDEGYAVQGLSHGAEALGWLAGHAAALILLDMRMPVLDGWAFARAYQADPGPHAPI